MCGWGRIHPVRQDPAVRHSQLSLSGDPGASRCGVWQVSAVQVLFDHTISTSEAVAIYRRAGKSQPVSQRLSSIASLRRSRLICKSCSGAFLDARSLVGDFELARSSATLMSFTVWNRPV